MSYRADVAEAKRLRKRSEEDQWRLAELTWRNIRPQGEATQREWAEDIGVHHSHVGRLAQVWGRFGDARRQERPSFWNAYEKIRAGDMGATSGTARAERALRSASPAAVARVVAESPDFQRAIARNVEAREAIEEESIGVRARSSYEPDRDLPAKVSHRVSRALEMDEAVEYLRGAARDIGNAIAASEIHGVRDVEGEAEALRSIKRLIRIYENKVEITDADEEFLASIGVKLGR